MRDTGRTKEAERNIGQGGVKNQTFGSINRHNIHVGCDMIETKNSRLLHILSTPVLSPHLPLLCVVCIYHYLRHIKDPTWADKERQIEVE